MCFCWAQQKCKGTNSAAAVQIEESPVTSHGKRKHVRSKSCSQTITLLWEERRERVREDKKDRKARLLEQSRWEEWGGEESQHLAAVRHHTTLMVNLFFCRRGERKGNLFPVIFHPVSLCSYILHLLHQLFTACADRWPVLFDMHSPLAHSPTHFPLAG